VIGERRVRHEREAVEVRKSLEVKAALLRFYDRLSAGDARSFDELVSGDAATVVIGTSPGEWKDRERLRVRFETEGPRIAAGTPLAYEEGTLAWAVDEPTFRFTDGHVVKARLTAVFHRDEGPWKLVHMHVSAGVPDEEVAALQQRWLPQSGERA
jgi:ketosteroid isomerase-like protein